MCRRLEYRVLSKGSCNAKDCTFNWINVITGIWCAGYGAGTDDCRNRCGNPDFSTLVTAVTEAGLVDTLNSEGPFTVFAPTNAAFDALGADAIASVLADKELLTSILTYHVVLKQSTGGRRGKPDHSYNRAGVRHQHFGERWEGVSERHN